MNMNRMLWKCQKWNPRCAVWGGERKATSVCDTGSKLNKQQPQTETGLQTAHATMPWPMMHLPCSTAARRHTHELATAHTQRRPALLDLGGLESGQRHRGLLAALDLFQEGLGGRVRVAAVSAQEVASRVRLPCSVPP